MVEKGERGGGGDRDQEDGGEVDDEEVVPGLSSTALVQQCWVS